MQQLCLVKWVVLVLVLVLVLGIRKQKKDLARGLNPILKRYLYLLLGFKQQYSIIVSICDKQIIVVRKHSYWER